MTVEPLPTPDRSNAFKSYRRLAEQLESLQEQMDGLWDDMWPAEKTEARESARIWGVQTMIARLQRDPNEAWEVVSTVAPKLLGPWESEPRWTGGGGFSHRRKRWILGNHFGCLWEDGDGRWSWDDGRAYYGEPSDETVREAHDAHALATGFRIVTADFPTDLYSREGQEVRRRRARTGGST